MKLLRLIINYFCFCGIEKEDYRILKKDAYVSNFIIWRALHFLMAAVFGILFVSTFLSNIMQINRVFYLCSFIYSIAALSGFFLLKKDSLFAQFLIYLSISILFILGCFITANKPDYPAVTFVVFLLIAPLFMVDKPYFMAIELCCASTVFLIWMHRVKPYDIWMVDLANVIIFTIVGIFLNILANAVRIKEFVYTRQINILKDTDELTGLKNKGALIRGINEYLSDDTGDKGLMFMFDVDRFKTINDTYGHDVGDNVIEQIGKFLAVFFKKDEIVGRFGGDEFLIFIKGRDDSGFASEVANNMIKGISENVFLPDKEKIVSVSVGIAKYDGVEKDYKSIFKRTDMALYKAKADTEKRYCIYE